MTDFSPPVSPRFCPFLLFLGSSDVNHLMCGNRRSLAPSNYRLRRHCTITAIVPRSTHLASCVPCLRSCQVLYRSSRPVSALGVLVLRFEGH